MNRGRGGFTLVEVVVSGAVLVIAAMMLSQVLSVSDGLLQKSRNFKIQQEKLEWDILKGIQPSEAEAVTIEISGHGNWEVTVETYEQELGDHKGTICIRTVRNEIHEE